MQLVRPKNRGLDRRISRASQDALDSSSSAGQQFAPTENCFSSNRPWDTSANRTRHGSVAAPYSRQRPGTESGARGAFAEYGRIGHSSSSGKCFRKLSLKGLTQRIQLPCSRVGILPKGASPHGESQNRPHHQGRNVHRDAPVSDLQKSVAATRKLLT